MKTMPHTPLRFLNLLNCVGMVWILLTLMFHFVELPRWFMYGGLGLFFATWLVEFVCEKRWQGFKLRWQNGYFLLFFAFFLLAVLYRPWDTDTHFERLLGYRYPLLGFGLVGLFGLNSYYRLRWLFIAMLLIAVGIGAWILIHVPYHSDIPFYAWQEQFAAYRVAHVNAHMGFNFYLNVALVGTWFILFRDRIGLPWWALVLVALSGLFCLGLLLISEGRTGFMMGMLLTTLLLTIELFRWRKWLGIALMAAGLAGAGWMVTHHSRVNEHNLQTELRFLYWRSAFELIRERPILGYGISRAQEEFSEVSMKYVEEEWRRAQWEPYRQRLDTHNQYIQCLLETGIIGLLLLLAMYIGPMILDNNHRLLSMALMGICALQSVFDMFVTGQFCTMFCVLTLFCLVVPHASRGETPAA